MANASRSRSTVWAVVSAHSSHQLSQRLSMVDNFSQAHFPPVSTLFDSIACLLSNPFNGGQRAMHVPLGNCAS